jgi:hypothetical protein
VVVGKKTTASRPHTPRDTDTARSTHAREQSQTKEQAKEQDAHEWLLEHYAGNTPSPSTSTVPPSMARVRGRRATSASGPSERTHSRTPAPEIAITLEQELDGPSKHEPDTDPDIVLELVAESLDAEDRLKSSRVSMEVDDELLSLVNDPVPVPALAPTQRYPYAAPPPSLRVSKPLTPTIVTVSSPSFVSPAPASPFQPAPMSERGSMPPPATTHITVKGAGKKAESGAAKGKKTAKVCTFCLFNMTLVLNTLYSLRQNPSKLPSREQRPPPKPKPKLLQTALVLLPPLQRAAKAPKLLL